MGTKNMLKSKILWINIIPVILEILHLFDVQFLQAMGLPQTWQVKVIALIALTTSVLTIIFRFGSNKQLTVVALLLLMTGLPGCSAFNSIARNTNFAVLQTPTHPNDTISVEAKVWGVGDLISQFVPADSKFGKAWANSKKHCQVKLTSLPEDVNDTLAVRVTCHSLGEAVKK